MPSSPGDLLVVRDRPWRVTRVCTDGGTTALDLTGLDPGARHARRTLLAPFERIEPVACLARPRVVPRERWMRGLAASCLGDGPYDLPRAAIRARAALLSYQLAPTLAVLGGLASRVLIADEVGLGKTVQAALLLSELMARGLVARALVIVPAGLAEQWQRELADRVDIRAELCDAAWALRAARALPPDANPWQAPRVALVSHDYVKQPEVLNLAAACAWDLVVVDEAHTLHPSTWRAEAGDRLARLARWLVLLTATPHGGDEAAFRALCNTGRHPGDDVLALFRRTREDVGLPRSRVTRRLRIRPSTSEARLHDQLRRYAARIWDAPAVSAGARLATVVLTKRALSSTSAAFRSIDRRRALLANHADRPAAIQPALPFGDGGPTDRPGDELSDAVLQAPGLADRRLEQRWLATLSTLAFGARRADAKQRALVRLVRRTREPLVVFTEYRDTLAELVRALAPVASVATLHGAQAADERRDALARFGDGRARVLVATDAASEGLNLHARCRLVVVYELPWNPNRLEQRVGRVDRLGQTGRVHVLELILADSGEEVVLARLAVRRGRIAAALDPHALEPGGLEAAVVLGRVPEPAAAPRPVLRSPRPLPAPPGAVLRLELVEECRRACTALDRLRRLALPGRLARQRDEDEDLEQVLALLARRAPWVTAVEAPWPASPGEPSIRRPALALVAVAEVHDAAGRPVASIPAALAAPLPRSSRSPAPIGHPAGEVLRVLPFVEALVSSRRLLAEAARATGGRAHEARLAHARLLARLRLRDAAIRRERRARAHPAAPDLFGRIPGPGSAVRPPPGHGVADSWPSAPGTTLDDASAGAADEACATRLSIHLALLLT